jgi:DNA polymerase-3 subunit epsilon
MYAIVDIETTGGHALANGITEIAIVVHNGKEVVNHYQTLVNPGVKIPEFISALTGISQEMVMAAPPFSVVASEVFELLKNNIFIAHNVNFDYSFVKHHLANAGYNLQTKKLCTVRLARKIIPGKTSYSLGKLCQQIGIKINARHRAMGDCEATAQLFSLLLSQDAENHIGTALKKYSKEQCLPPNVHKTDFEALPQSPGIYYFHDQKDKIIYVGKAVNIKKRVLSHFSNNSGTKQKQNFLRDIFKISCKPCGTELMALVTEAIEIKRLWPIHNRSLKRFEFKFGLYVYEDQRNCLRLAIDVNKKYAQPIYAFHNMMDAQTLLRNLIREFNLCPKYANIQKSTEACIGLTESYCRGICENREEIKSYNLRVKAALNYLRTSQPSFAILDNGRTADEKSCILIERGQFYGMGFIESNANTDYEYLKSTVTRYAANQYMVNLVQNYGLNYPDKRIEFDEEIAEDAIAIN